MKNILGAQENLILYNKAGIIVYQFVKGSDGFSLESTYNEFGNELTYKNSDGFSLEKTYNEFGKVLTYKDSEGYSYEKNYNEFGNELTYKNSDGVERGFDIPEFTMEQLVEKLGNFKLIK